MRRWEGKNRDKERGGENDRVKNGLGEGGQSKIILGKPFHYIQLFCLPSQSSKE
jgi:hypothetical protein